MRLAYHLNYALNNIACTTLFLMYFGFIVISLAGIYRREMLIHSISVRFLLMGTLWNGPSLFDVGYNSIT